MNHKIFTSYFHTTLVILIILLKYFNLTTNILYRSIPLYFFELSLNEVIFISIEDHFIFFFEFYMFSFEFFKHRQYNFELLFFLGGRELVKLPIKAFC